MSLYQSSNMKERNVTTKFISFQLCLIPTSVFMCSDTDSLLLYLLDRMHGIFMSRTQNSSWGETLTKHTTVKWTFVFTKQKHNMSKFLCWNFTCTLVLKSPHRAQVILNLKFQSHHFDIRLYFTQCNVVGLSVQLHLSIVQTVPPHTTEWNTA